MSIITDLRSFLEVLAAAGQLIRIAKPVSLTHELADVAATLARTGGGAPLFENVTGSEWPVFTSAVSNQKQAALALGWCVVRVALAQAGERQCAHRLVHLAHERQFSPGRHVPQSL